jgi:hypothetical protein
LKVALGFVAVGLLLFAGFNWWFAENPDSLWAKIFGSSPITDTKVKAALEKLNELQGKDGFKDSDAEKYQKYLRDTVSRRIQVLVDKEKASKIIDKESEEKKKLGALSANEDLFPKKADAPRLPTPFTLPAPDNAYYSEYDAATKPISDDIGGFKKALIALIQEGCSEGKFGAESRIKVVDDASGWTQPKFDQLKNFPGVVEARHASLDALHGASDDGLDAKRSETLEEFKALQEIMKLKHT